MKLFSSKAPLNFFILLSGIKSTKKEMINDFDVLVTHFSFHPFSYYCGILLHIYLSRFIYLFPIYEFWSLYFIELANVECVWKFCYMPYGHRKSRNTISCFMRHHEIKRNECATANDKKKSKSIRKKLVCFYIFCNSKKKINIFLMLFCC